MKLLIKVGIFNQNLIYWVNSNHMDWYAHTNFNPDKKILFNKFSDIREFFSKHYSYQKASKYLSKHKGY